jgi:hypothetical protein
MKEETHVQKKKREKRNIITYMHVYIFFPKQLTHPNHTSREVWARGAKCKGPFFLPYWTKTEASNSALKAQGELSPVVHNKRKAQVNGIGPPIKPKTQNWPTQSQAYVCCNGIRPFKIIQRKEREKHPREAPFSLLFWCVARGAKRAHFQDGRNGSPTS